MSNDPFERLDPVVGTYDQAVARARKDHDAYVATMKAKLVEFDQHLQKQLIDGVISRRHLWSETERTGSTSH